MSQSNVEVRYILARGERHICLYAQRDIAANEELFFDYNYTNESPASLTNGGGRQGDGPLLS